MAHDDIALNIEVKNVVLMWAKNKKYYHKILTHEIGKNYGIVKIDQEKTFQLQSIE